MFRRRRRPLDEFAVTVYDRVARDSRRPALFEMCGIPDTLDGRFDSLALHAALMIERLRREPDGEALAQSFFDAMFRHLDLTLREIGVQDLGVGRRIKIMAEGFHGRALAYRAALVAGQDALLEVLRRNAYGGTEVEETKARALAGHVLAYVEDLGQTSREALPKS